MERPHNARKKPQYFLNKKHHKLSETESITLKQQEVQIIHHKFWACHFGWFSK